MKHLLQIAALALSASLCAACSTDDEAGETDPTGVELRITRETASASPYDFRAHMNRIYVGERKPEHGTSELHIREISDLYSVDGGASLRFRTVQLKPRWYKFVVLSVPKIHPGTEGIDARNFAIFTEEQPDEASCDLNRHLIDYTPILEKAPGSSAPDRPTADGDIFRAVMNRWAQGHLIVEEEITLKRINGRLDIDMGILADQFPHRITSISVEVTTPSRLYLTDDNTQAVKTAAPRTFTYTTLPDDMTSLPEAQHRHHIISLPLLPGTVSGTITVNGTDRSYTYDLTSSGGQVEIKPNTVTRLHFNGITPGWFDVRYAGFDDTGIDVEEGWNGGWN